MKQRAIDAKQALNMLYLLNDGADIQSMLEAGDNGRGFDFSQFKGSLDVKSAAVMGHSYGGATTIQALSEDPRFMLVQTIITATCYWPFQLKKMAIIISYLSTDACLAVYLNMHTY